MASPIITDEELANEKVSAPKNLEDVVKQSIKENKVESTQDDMFIDEKIVKETEEEYFLERTL